MEGKATGEQHRSDGPAGQISKFAFDYMFVTKHKVILREELTEEDEKMVLIKSLVAKDSKSRALFAHVVTRKALTKRICGNEIG